MNLFRISFFYKKVCYFFFCMYLLSETVMVQPEEIVEPSFEDLISERISVSTFINSLTDEELLGQLFFLGYPEKNLSIYMEQWISVRNLGGVKIFTRNVENLEQLVTNIKKMQSLAQKSPKKIPLLVATDQEGGWVRQIKHNMSESPGNLGIGASNLPLDAYYTGYFIGQELANLGINMNFAPTIDVYTHPNATVIGPRSFSSDPIQTGLLALAYFHGLKASGIIATAKHYPGHGGAEGDSHGFLPVVESNLETIWNRDLVPYRFLIRDGIMAIMTGHVAYPTITGIKQQSSLVPFFQRKLLRERLGFNGVIITDDLEMAGALYGMDSPAIATIKAIEAGNDMVLISHTPEWQEAAWKLSKEKMNSDSTFHNYITESAYRIIKMKKKAFSDSPSAPIYPNSEEIDKIIPTKQASNFFFDASARAVTVIKNKQLPLEKLRKKTLIIGQFDTFIEQGKIRFPNSDTYFFPYTPFYSPLESYLSIIPKLCEEYETIIFALANYNSLEILKRLESFSERLIVISTLTPIYLKETPWVQTAIAVYGTSSHSFKAGFAVLAGDYIAKGILPIKRMIPDLPTLKDNY